MRTIDDNEIDEVIEAPAQPNTGMRMIDDSEIEVEEKPVFNPGLAGAAQSVVDAGVDATKYVGEIGHDFAVGAAEGLTLGAADEIGAAGMTALEKVLNKIPGTAGYEAAQVDQKLLNEGFHVPQKSTADTYVEYQKGSEAEFDKAAERSPVSNFAGNIGGNIVTGTAVAGMAAKAAPKLAASIANKGGSLLDIASKEGKMKAALELFKRSGKLGAVAAPEMLAESVMASKNNLVGSNAQPEELGKDVLDNMAFGGLSLLGLQGMTDVAAPAAKKVMDGAGEMFNDYASGSPMARKAKKAFDFGTEGINPTTEASINKLESKQIKDTQGVQSKIQSANASLGADVGNSLKLADEAGTLVDIKDSLNKASSILKKSYKMFGDNFDDIVSEDLNDSRGRKIFESLVEKNGPPIKPTEAKLVLDDVDAFIGKFLASNNRTPEQDGILNSLKTIRQKLSEEIKTQVPQYRQAASRFEEFRRLVPENAISGKVPTDISGVYMGNLKNKEAPLFKSLEKLTTGATAQGSGAKDVRQAMSQFQEGLKEFEARSLAQRRNPLLNADEMIKDIRGFSDEAQMLNDMQTVKSPSMASGNIVQQGLQIGRGGILTGANLTGRGVKAAKNLSLTDLSKKVYNMPDNKLTMYADKLMAVPGLKQYGSVLRQGIENGDLAKKNAALFSIMQNPSARIILNDENEED